jgi:predicted nucleic-acid-binding Zn-ribbon protein
MNSPKVVVIHSTGTQNESAPNNMSWIDYWQDRKKQEVPSMCPCCGKKPDEDNPMVGAHVESLITLLDSVTSRYITPTCKKCNDKYKGNHRYHSFEVCKSDLLELDE